MAAAAAALEAGVTNGLAPDAATRPPPHRTLHVDPAACFAAAAAAARRKARTRARLLAPPPPTALPAAAAAAAAAAMGGDDDDGAAGLAALSAAKLRARVLTKGDFSRLEVLGQFNLGFAVCRLGNDLFVLDQHACEEKTLFESLQRSTRLHEQALLRPFVFECPAAEEAVILDHLAVFAFNGFKFETPIDHEAPPGRRLKLLTRPHSKVPLFCFLKFG